MQSLSPDYLARLRFDTQQLATLRAMKAEGVIAPTGRGRAAKWAKTGLQSTPVRNDSCP